MIYNQLMEVLKSQGVEVIKTEVKSLIQTPSSSYDRKDDNF